MRGLLCLCGAIRRSHSKTLASPIAHLGSLQVRPLVQENPEVEKKLAKNGNSDFYVSDITDQFEKTAATILKKRITLNKITHW